MRLARVLSRAAVSTRGSVAQRPPVTPWLLPSRVDQHLTSLDSPQRPCDVPRQGTPLERVGLFSIAIDNKIRTPRTPRPTAARSAPAALWSTIETGAHSPGPSRSATSPRNVPLSEAVFHGGRTCPLRKREARRRVIQGLDLLPKSL